MRSSYSAALHPSPEAKTDAHRSREVMRKRVTKLRKATKQYVVGSNKPSSATRIRLHTWRVSSVAVMSTLTSARKSGWGGGPPHCRNALIGRSDTCTYTSRDPHSAAKDLAATAAISPRCMLHNTGKKTRTDAISSSFHVRSDVCIRKMSAVAASFLIWPCAHTASLGQSHGPPRLPLTKNNTARVQNIHSRAALTSM